MKKRRWLRVLWRIFAALVVAVGVIGVASARKVGTDEMAHTIQRGEWVFILPLPIIKGDVVAVRDPLDPDTVLLRRAVAGRRQTARYEDGSFRINGKRIRQTEMGDADGRRVLKEVLWSSPPARPNNWLIRRDQTAVRWDGEAVDVPEDHWFLLADDRDGAIDSRWWGPVPESQILGVVRLHMGKADEWRPAWKIMKPIP